MPPKLFVDLDRAAQYLEEAVDLIALVEQGAPQLTQEQRYRLDSQLCRLDATIMELVSLALEE